jgi:hypothetical protein
MAWAGNFFHTPFMETTPLLPFAASASCLNDQRSQSLGFSPVPPFFVPPGAPLRASHEVEVLSALRVEMVIVIDGIKEGRKLLKQQVRGDTSVRQVVDSIVQDWSAQANAVALADGDQLRFAEYLVKERGALVLGDAPAALLFPDKNSNTSSIELILMYERLEKRCCSCCSVV